MSCTKVNTNDWSKNKLLYALWSECSKNEKNEPTLNEIEETTEYDYIDTFKDVKIGIDITNWPNVDHYWYDNYYGENSFENVLDKFDVYSKKYNDKILYFVSEQLHIDLNKFIKKRKIPQVNNKCYFPYKYFVVIGVLTMAVFFSTLV